MLECKCKREALYFLVGAHVAKGSNGFSLGAAAVAGAEADEGAEMP